jgi:hypothetical protein
MENDPQNPGCNPLAITTTSKETENNQPDRTTTQKKIDAYNAAQINEVLCVFQKLVEEYKDTPNIRISLEPVFFPRIVIDNSK